jgi:hypothetical protein
LSAVAGDRDSRLAAAAYRESLLMAAGRPLLLPAVAQYVAIRRAYQHAQQRARSRIAAQVLGMGAGGPAAQARVAAALAGQPVEPATDAVAAEWTLRYGAAQVAAGVEVDTGYLTAWLPDALDAPHADVAGFAVELRALVSELEHVLGETRDEQWLGRCPAELLDDAGQPLARACGYGLWQDPYRTRVECPRCHSTWREADWLLLATRIHRAWPIDQRRLYTAADRKAAELNVDRMPRCRGCERTMAVQWRQVRRRGYREPAYRPAALVCPIGCIAGGTVAAA